MNPILKQLTINPTNRQYYSEDFIKGFECGTQRQLEADKADIPTWIPCKERLPKENTEVLISLEWKSVDIGWVRNGTWMSDYVNDYEDDVVAWMPLPEPWRGVDDEARNETV